MPNNWTLDAAPPLSLVIAAPADRANGWYHAFITDGRFQLLVGTPTLPGALHIVEAMRLFNDLLAGRHRIPSEAVHLVLNRVRSVSLGADEVVRAGKAQRRDFPPLAAVLDEDPAIEEALNRKRPAYLHSEPLRKVARSLGDLLLGQSVGAVPNVPVGKVYTLGPVKIRV